MIFERWITAADSLGHFWSGFSAYSVNDVAGVLRDCRESILADHVLQDGPSALCRLDLERRNELAAKVEPTLGAGLKRLLQSEAVEMERSLGATVPVRVAIFGKSAKREVIGRIMDREFPNQRGYALFLERPSAKHLVGLENWRHQMLWPEAPLPARKAPHNVTRLWLPQPPDVPFLRLEQLVRLRPAGHLHSSRASKPYATFHPGEILRFGGLSLETLGGNTQKAWPSDASEVLIASADHAYSDRVPIAFLSAGHPARATAAPRRDGRVRVFLGHPRNSYARLDFNPLDRKAGISVYDTRNGKVVSQAICEIRKDRTILKALMALRADVSRDLEEAIVMDMEDSIRSPAKRKMAHRQSEFTADTAMIYAARYLEWLEWHPEAATLEAQARLAALECAMLEDIPPELRDVRPELLRRDLYRAFEHFLMGWGLE